MQERQYACLKFNAMKINYFETEYDSAAFCLLATIRPKQSTHWSSHQYQPTIFEMEWEHFKIQTVG